MRDYALETEKRIAFIRKMLDTSNCKGIVYGNSGGKDSGLVGILCKLACNNVLGVIMPCQSKRNYNEDMLDALEVAGQFGIETVTVDLTDVKKTILGQINNIACVSDVAQANIAPRLRMTTLYTIAQSKGYLVAGTGNRSEGYVGYYTKWGDGAHDFNPIADLTVTEVYEFLEHLGAPQNIIKKAPSAGLFEGQTDEGEMGIRYAQIDAYLLRGEGDETVINKIESMHAANMHKTSMPIVYKDNS